MEYLRDQIKKIFYIGEMWDTFKEIVSSGFISMYNITEQNVRKTKNSSIKL